MLLNIIVNKPNKYPRLKEFMNPKNINCSNIKLNEWIIDTFNIINKIKINIMKKNDNAVEKLSKHIIGGRGMLCHLMPQFDTIYSHKI